MPLGEINKSWIQRRLAALGKNQRQLAEFLGITPSRVSEMLRGGRRVQAAEAISIAEFLEASLSEVHDAFGLDDSQSRYGRLIILGYIDATSGSITVRAHVDNSTLEEIDAPFPGYTGSVVKIRGQSMHPRFRDGEVIGFTRDGHDISRLIGEEVVVETEDGRLLLKILRRGTQPNRYTLLSLNRDEEPIQDIALSWAAPIDFLIPRRGK